MRTIAIINQKGGCGKTTVALNLAATLARQGRRTLLADMDPQGHCALGLSVPEKQLNGSMADLLAAGLDGTTSAGESTWQVARGLDLLPAAMNLAGLEQQLSTASDRDRRLAQVLATVEDHYPYCIIDCPPTIGLLTFNALRAADEVIVPIETGYFALQGAIKQRQTIEMLARRVAHRVRLHMLATMYDPAADHARPIFAELQRQFSDYLLPMTIHYSGRLQQVTSVGQSIAEAAPDSPAARDFRRLGQWLIDHPPTSEPSMPRPVAAPAAVGNGEVNGNGDGGAQASEPPPRGRAAELVERARLLAARTASLSARLDRSPHESGDGPVAREAAAPPSPSPPLAAVTDSDEAPTAASASEPAAGPLADRGFGGATPSPLTVDNQADSNGASAVHRSSTAPMPASLSEQQAAGASDRAHSLARTFGVRVTASGLLFVQPIHGTGGATVAVVGDFNNWDPAATPLRRDDRLGIWQGCVPVAADAPGRYQYRLVIDGRWTLDPYNERTETDERGEVQNVVETGR